VLVSHQILRVLKDSPEPLTTGQLVERTGVRETQTYLPLFRLREAGTIIRKTNDAGKYVYAIDNSVINCLPEYKLEQPPAAVTPKPKKKVGRPKGSAGKPKMTPEQTNHLLSIVSENIQKHGVVKKWVSEEEHTQVKKKMEAYEKQWLDSLAVIDYLERKLKGQ
jgi:DNA-binding transcriptional ArsR family regulator